LVILFSQQHKCATVSGNLKFSKLRLYSRVIIISTLFAACRDTKSPIKSDDPIVSVSVDLIRDDKALFSQYVKTNSEEYFITIRLTSTQDSSIHFKIMTCSWGESFITNTDSIFVLEQECDNNFPTEIEIKPHKSKKFFGKLTSLVRSPDTTTFKLGLVDLPYKRDRGLFSRYSKSDKMKYKIFWSNEIILKSELNTYKDE
jgi:hypothetical protein